MKKDLLDEMAHRAYQVSQARLVLQESVDCPVTLVLQAREDQQVEQD